MAKLSCGLSIPGVTEKDGRYYKIIRNKWHKLSRIDEGVNALYRALFELDPAQPGTIGELIKMYGAAGMDELKPATRSDYTKILPRLMHHFGHITIGQLKPSQIAVWLETRRKAGKGSTRANREFAVLSSVHKFGMRQGWLEANPCIGVPRNKERPRRRVVTDAEFLEGFHKAPENFQDLISAAYLSGTRETDIVAWTRSGSLRPDGIHYIESKTGKPHHVEWTDALRYFVRRAMARFPDAEYVFVNSLGQKWGQWAINSQMRRLEVGWCFKDLRAKAQTDSEHQVLGHSGAMEQLYRKALRTKPVR